MWELNNALIACFAKDGDPFDVLVHRLVEYGKQRVVAKLLTVHMQHFQHRMKDLDAYVPPLVLEKVPGHKSLSELAVKLDDVVSNGGSETTVKFSDELDVPLSSVEYLIRNDVGTARIPVGDHHPFDAFLSDDSQRLFLLLGEPGAGKSLFPWHLCKQKEEVYKSMMESSTLMPFTETWIPVAIDLKKYKTSDVKGLLPRYLKEECKLSTREMKICWGAFSASSEPSPYKLLVFCDGFDELRVEHDAVSTEHPPAVDVGSFLEQLLYRSEDDGGRPDVKVVVTCRDRHFRGDHDEDKLEQLFGPHSRRVILPLLKRQIQTYVHKRTGPSASGTAGSQDAVGSTVTLGAHDYLKAIYESNSLDQIVRNPFILSMFVDTLPLLLESGSTHKTGLSCLNRFSIYSMFIRQHITRLLEDNVECKAMLNALKIGSDDSATREEVINAVMELCGVIAREMMTSKRLTIDMGTDPMKADTPWSNVREGYFKMDTHRTEGLRTKAATQWDGFLPDALFDLECRHFTRESFRDSAVQDAYRMRAFVLSNAASVCPLRKAGDGYMFLHKPFFEYFVWMKSSGLSSDDLSKAGVQSDRTAGVLGIPVFVLRKRGIPEEHIAYCVIGDGSRPPGVFALPTLSI